MTLYRKCPRALTFENMQSAPPKRRRHKTCRQRIMGVGKRGGGRERSTMGVEHGLYEYIKLFLFSRGVVPEAE
jgi:hypothetical protein